MKNNYIVIFACFILLVLSCQEKNECEAGSNYLSSVLEEKLEVISKNAKSQEVFSGETYRALFFFEEITKIKSSASYGDVSEYQSYNDFKKDKEKWLKWYDENKCNYSDEEVMKIEEQILSETPWIN